MTKVSDSDKRNDNGTYTNTHRVEQDNGHGYETEVTKENKGGIIPNWVVVESKTTKF